jgi:hypothetical protein
VSALAGYEQLAALAERERASADAADWDGSPSSARRC